MERKLFIDWNIYNGEIDREERYCHNCGRKVEFIDSLKRRQNANGKNIFHYAIYKCPKGHTWNKMLDTFKAVPGLENIHKEICLHEEPCEEILIAKFIEEGIAEVNISIAALQKKIRIDKLLASRIRDISRIEISKLIDKGVIRINGQLVKAKTTLKEKDMITIFIK